MLRLTAAVMLGLLAATSAGAAEGDEVIGSWRNVRNTMHIKVDRCGASICGTVEWANDEATADARRGGTTNLIGTQIFRDFHRGNDGIWRGKVFVPDLNKTFSGTLTQVDRDTLKGAGCLVGRVLCKSKVLVRIP